MTILTIFCEKGYWYWC